jgi:hypothetical protein
MVLLGAVMTVTAMLPVAASPAAAAAAPSDEMKEALRLNPGSRQLNDNQVELAEGVIMTIPSEDGGVTTQGDGWCGAGTPPDRPHQQPSPPTLGRPDGQRRGGPRLDLLTSAPAVVTLGW